MTDLDQHPRWREAVARNRKRFERGDEAERGRIAHELDALWAELTGETPTDVTAVAPRYASLRALLTWRGAVVDAD